MRHNYKNDLSKMALLCMIFEMWISRGQPVPKDTLSQDTFTIDKDSNAGSSYRHDLNSDLDFFYMAGTTAGCS